VRVAEGLEIDAGRMRANLDVTRGAVFSSRILLHLVERGMPRDEAYAVVQEAAMAAVDRRTTVRDELAARGVAVPDEVLEPEAFLARHDHVRARLDALRRQSPRQRALA
jgi:adenylosuccinate lyase